MGVDPGRSAPPERKPSRLRHSAVPAANDGCGMPLTPGAFCALWNQGCAPASVYHSQGRPSRAPKTDLFSLLPASWQPGVWFETQSRIATPGGRVERGDAYWYDVGLDPAPDPFSLAFLEHSASPPRERDPLRCQGQENLIYCDDIDR